jgi:hypothetical protein
MNALGSAASLVIRVLSPRIEPPEFFDDGSTARTATRRPSRVRLEPSVSISVDLPTPGAPVIPTRIAAPAPGARICTSARARAWWSLRRLSTSVIARASAARSPERSFRATASAEESPSPVIGRL